MVETFRQREVADSGQVPGYQNVSYSPDAFGGQVARALGQLGQVSTQLAENQAKIDSEKKANDALTVFNTAKDKVRPMFFDPTYGIYAQEGGNAMGVGATAAATMQNTYEEQAKLIDDPETKAVFEKLWLRETDNTKDTVARHEMAQLGKYKVETAKATLLGSVTDAYNGYNNPEAIEEAKHRALQAILVNSDGLPEEAVKNASKEAVSQINLAVISRYAGEDPSKALEYYRAHKDELSGKDHVTATAFVDAARVVEQANSRMEQITGQGGAASSWLLNAQINAESSGDPTAESSAGASGLLQVMPETARELLRERGQGDIADLGDKELKAVLKGNKSLNIALGKTYMNKQLVRYEGDVEAALVAYNAGPGAADAFLAHNAGVRPGQRDYNVPGWKGIKNESEAYVKKILSQAPGGGLSTPPGQRMTRESWDLKNFAPEDLMAPTAGAQFVDARAARGLDMLADSMGRLFPGLKVSVNERGDTGSTAGKRRGTSDPKDNPHVSKSKHLEGHAFDVQTQSWSDEQKAAFITEARKLGFKGFGFYGPSGHLHIDMGNERTWGKVPDWAKNALGTPAAQGPISSATQPSGSAIGSATDGLPPTSTFFGPGANTAQSAFMSTKTPDLNAWMAEAELEPDPQVRERLKAGLRIKAAELETAAKAEKAGIQQMAWETVLQGSVAQLGPEILSRLEPSFVSSLYTYEENRAKGGPMPMDWGVWSSIPTDPAEIVKIQPMDYRNKLDDEHFDKLINIYREAQNKINGKDHDKGLLANMRTTAQISSDVAGSQGWKASSPSGAKSIAIFNQKLDERIAGEQAAKGGELSPIEIQDIADKLLINDRDTFAGLGGQGSALEMEDPNAFVSASDWEEVQPDDQKTLVQTYESYFNGAAPDLEEATDIYNRAMRVWLGGKPDGPLEEQSQLRETLERGLNRTLTDKDFEKYYGRYLLKFLGR